jgi:hypothetical protein
MTDADPVLARAIARRDEIKEELDKIDAFLLTYRQIANSIKLESANILGTIGGNSQSGMNLVDTAAVDEAREAEATSDAPKRRPRVTDNPKPRLVAQAGAELIRAYGKPMSRRAIHTALAERGMTVRGADPVKALGTMLWRSGADLLEQVEGHGYWLKGVPLPDPHEERMSIFGDKGLMPPE